MILSVQKTLVLLVCFAFLLVRPSFGQEPAEKFLEALRGGQYFDVALDYLDSLEKSDLISDEFRKGIPFERAETLIASVTSMRDLNQADKRLDEAQKILASIKGNSLEEKYEIANQQAALFFNRSNFSKSLGSSDRLTEKEKEVFLTRSRDMLKQSRENFLIAKSAIRELIDPKSPNALKEDVQLRLRLATTMESLGDSSPALSEEQKKYYDEAIEEYKALHNSHFRNYPVPAWNSKLYEARCYQKLQRYSDAIRALDEIFAMKGGAFSKMHKIGYPIACDCWERLPEYPASEVVARLEPVIAEIGKGELRDPAWLRVQLELAIASFREGERLQQETQQKLRNEGAAFKRKAEKLLRTVAKIQSPYQQRARDLIAQWKISMTEPKESEVASEPKSFEDARNLIKDNAREIESLGGEIRSVTASLATADDAQKKTLEAELNRLQQQRSELVSDTLTALSTVNQWVGDDTSPIDINQLRYYRSFCYFADEKYYESAIIGEFMMQKFPGIEWTRQASDLVMQSYTRLNQQFKDKDREFERNKLKEVCGTVLSRWPGSDEAGRAAMMMISQAIESKELDQVDGLFKQMPEDYPARSTLAARTGNRLWNDYREQSSKSPEKKSELSPLLERAINYLSESTKGLSQEKLTFESANASRLLADALLESGNLERALAVIEGAEVSSLDLIKQKHPAIFNHPNSDQFVRDTYRVALRVYLAALKKSTEPQNLIDKMKGILDAMRQRVEALSNPEDQKQLSQIYSLIAVELLSQFDSKPQQEKRSFAGYLMGFLDAIEKDSEDPETVLWAGSTALKVANSLKEVGLDGDIKSIFDQAASSLTRAEQMGFERHPRKEDLLTELKRQRALAKRGAGDFEAAMEQFIEILDKNRSNIKVQLDAAETLQAWGASTKRAKLFAEAIKGNNRKLDPKTKRESNLVWGWEFIAKATRGQNEDLFCQSIYQWAQCLLEVGLLENDKTRIATALKLVEFQEEKTPAMKNSNWKPRFDALKQRIKQSQ